MIVYLPNEGEIEMSVDMRKFKKDKEIGDTVFGWYNGTYISIKKIKRK